MNQLQITEFKGQRVLTTQQIADGYGTKPRVISNNFNRNKGRFQEGKHFILLEGEYLKSFLSDSSNLGFAKNVNKLYLWTEKGALLHAKSLGTDEAWDMYDILVDTYFKVQKIQQQTIETLPSDPMEILRLTFQAQENTVKEVEIVKERVSDLEENTPLSPGDYSYIGRRINQRVSEVARGYGRITQEQRGALYKDINQGVKVVTGVSTRTQLRAKHFDTVLAYINDWEPSTATKMQVRQTSFEFED